MAKNLRLNKQNKTPVVSVILSVYNGEKYLRESIDSILKQSFKDFEFIIINDGSNDDSLDIIKSFNDLRINLITRENKGLVKSLNEGIEIAKGDYIARQDADDISASNRLENELAAISTDQSIVLVSSFCHEINENGVKIRSLQYPTSYPDIIQEFLFRNHIVHGASMFNKDIFNKVGYYRESFRFAEDFDLWLRMINTGEICIIPKYLYKYRVIDESVSRKNLQKQRCVTSDLIATAWKTRAITKTISIRYFVNSTFNKYKSPNEQYNRCRLLLKQAIFFKHYWISTKLVFIMLLVESIAVGKSVRILR